METSQQVIDVDPRSVARPRQARTEFKEGPIEDLVQSIRAVGILHPVLLRRDGEVLSVIDGERRLRAAIALALPTVPALVSDRVLDAGAVVQRQLIANCIRESLSPLEQAHAIRQLMDESGCTAAEVAGRIARSAGTVSKLLALLDAPEDVRAKLASGEIGLKAAYDLSRAAAPSVPGAQPAARRPKLTAALDASRSVVVHGADSTMESFTAVLEELLARTRAARKQNVGLPVFLEMLRDQAKA